MHIFMYFLHLEPPLHHSGKGYIECTNKQVITPKYLYQSTVLYNGRAVETGNEDMQTYTASEYDLSTSAYLDESGSTVPYLGTP